MIFESLSIFKKEPETRKTPVKRDRETPLKTPKKQSKTVY